MKNKLSAATVVVFAVVLGMAGFASASTPTAAITGGATSLQTLLTGIAVAVIPIAAGLYGIKVGFRWLKSFVK